MSQDSLKLGTSGKSFAANATLSPELFKRDFRFNGYNKDITQAYYWHLNFALFSGKGYKPIKLEDYHYFSENSQFGTQLRQVKGGTIKAFQDNLNQLVQLVKIHLMPLLQELKKTEYYHEWFKTIVDNDAKIREERKKKEPDKDKIEKWRAARDQAINQAKDKWVTEVEGGRMYQIQRSQAEQGLDFTLLPTFFFGSTIENPLNKETLEVEIKKATDAMHTSEEAKRQVEAHFFRFHHWLPGAIEETTTTFRIKIAALKQFYAQIQMYISFMKPLLIEIARKSEGFEQSNFYKGFEMNNPDFVNLFDFSYSFVRLLYVNKFEREGFTLEDLEFSRYGLYLRSKKVIGFGDHAGKQGYILGEDTKDKYAFLACKTSPDKLSAAEFNRLKEEWEKNKEYIEKEDLITFPTFEISFGQKRRQQLLQTEQGAQPTPYMDNEIISKGYVWNIFELASYREKLKVDDLQLLETFIDEINVIKDDLMKYLNYLEGGEHVLKPNISDVSKEEKKKSQDMTIVTGPFRALGEMFTPLFPKFHQSPFKNQVSKKKQDDKRDDHHLKNKLNLVDDTWKVYSVYKKVNGFMQY